MKITVVRGDITRQDVEAVVTAANTKLRGGGGVDGAVHAAAGPRLLQASLALAPCPPGGAVITDAFDLAPVRWVIHAVGPIYRGPQDAATLTSAYTQALARADEVGATTVPFLDLHQRADPLSGRGRHPRQAPQRPRERGLRHSGAPPPTTVHGGHGPGRSRRVSKVPCRSRT